MWQLHLLFPEPARIQAGLRRVQVGSKLGLMCLCTRRVCVLAPRLWAPGLGQGGGLHSLNAGYRPHLLHKALCCWGSASVDAQSWVSWRSSRGWFKLSWLHSGSSSAVGLGFLGVGSPPAPFLCMKIALAKCMFAKWELRVLLGAAEKEMLLVNGRRV